MKATLPFQKRIANLTLMLAITLASLLPAGLRAQTTVEIGSGTSTNSYLPTYEFYNYSLTQQIYTASEIGMAGTISSISFYTAGSASRTWAIYMKHTSKTSFSGSYDWESIASSDLVFNGSVSYTSSGWTTITLSTPFAYNGTDNLLLCVDDNTGSYVSSIGKYSFTPTSGGNCAIRVYSDGTDYNALNPTSYSGTTMTLKNRIRLQITPGGISCYPPTNLAVTGYTANSVTLGWNASGHGESTWRVRYKAEGASSWTAVGNVTSTSSTVTGLTPETPYLFQVRSHCGSDDNSDWREVGFTPTAKITIGSNPSTASYLPTYCYYNYSLTQQIYTAAEIGNTPCSILSLDFFATSALTRNLDIYMVATNKSSFSSTSDGIIVSANDLVYSGNVSFAAGDWTTITLSNPFIHDGSHNVAIIVDDNTGSYVSSVPFNTYTASSQALYVYNDNSSYDPSVGNSFSGVLGYKNQIRILKGEGPTCSRPTNVTVGNVEARNATISWTGDADSYDLQYMTFASTTYLDEGFEGGSMPSGWSSSGYSSWSVGTGDYSTSTGAATGSYNAMITHSSTGNTTYLITPSMDLSGASNATLSFSYVNRSWGGDIDYLYVYYRLNGGAWQGPVFSTTAAHSAWTTQNVTLPAAACAANCQIGFCYTDEYGYGLGIDNVNITALAPVDPVTITGITSSSYNLTGLTPLTTYNVYVRSNCGSDQSNWAGPIPFTTTGITCPTVEVIGDGGTNTNSYLPSYPLYNYTLSQQIYTPCEIGGAGTIRSISFYNAGTTQSPIYDIYLVHTNKDEFNSATDWITVTNADKVFSGTVTMTSGTWTRIDFTTPFEYNGTSNLAVIVDDNIGSYTGSMSCRVYNADGNQAIYVYSDGTNYNALSPSSYTGTLLTVKNQLHFGICDQEANGNHTITASVNPSGAGTVSGAGSFGMCEEANLSASALGCFEFANWTENGVVVSTNPNYSFLVSHTSALTANFIVANSTGLVANNVTSHAADLSWSGAGDSYNVSYAEYGISSEGFEDGIPSEFSNTSSYPWILSSSNAHTGSYCLTSSNSGVASTTSTISLTVTYDVAGTISFYSMASSEGGSWDYGYFSIDGSQQFTEGGTGGSWTYHSFDVMAGTHTFT